MTIKEKKQFHQDLTDEIIEKETEIAEEITKLIINFFKLSEPGDWDNLKNAIIDYIYISLKQTIQITQMESSDVYNMNIVDLSKITNKDIDEYTYSKDGLTIIDRVDKAIKKAKEKDFNEANRKVLTFEVIRVLDNETLTVSRKFIKKNVKADYGMVIGGNGCSRDCCDGTNGEWVPVDEIEEPPYHPNCTCDIIYDDNELDDEEE